jgi:hypothetical protein
MIARISIGLACWLWPIATLAQPITGLPSMRGIGDLVAACWNIGSLSNTAMDVKVAVAFDLDVDARPIPDSIRLMAASSLDERDTQQAYEAARRAILRCGANGYGLPAESYDHWRQVELVFNPEGMRLR